MWQASRMKFRSVLPFFLVAVSSFAICAQDAQTKAEWTQKYNSINALFEKKNFAGFEALLDQNFVYEDQAGHSIHKETYIKTRVYPLRKMRTFSGTIKITSLKVVGNQATVDYDWDYQMALPGPRRDINFVGHESATDIWRKSGDKWLVVKAHLRSQSTKMVPEKKGS